MALIGPNEDPCPQAWAALAEHRQRKELRKVLHPPVDPRAKPKNDPKKFDRN